MKRVEFDCVCELANVMNDYILDNAHDEYPIVSAYANYEVAKVLVETLIMLENPIGAILELEDYEMSYYDKEYVVYLSTDGVTCEKCHHEGGYYNGGGDISFVHEDCNSNLLSHIDSQTICEFGIGSDDEEDCDCDECHCACTDKDTDDSESTHISRDKDGNPFGFSKTWATVKDGVHCYSSYSHYSSDVDMLRSVASDFGVRL